MTIATLLDLFAIPINRNDRMHTILISHRLRWQCRTHTYLLGPVFKVKTKRFINLDNFY